MLVDLEQKTATAITGGAEIHWIGKDTFAFSREVPDTDLRGTWLQTAGESERRVSPDPYHVGKGRGFIMSLHFRSGMCCQGQPLESGRSRAIAPRESVDNQLKR